jgi:hypothetical protein
MSANRTLADSKYSAIVPPPALRIGVIYWGRTLSSRRSERSSSSVTCFKARSLSRPLPAKSPSSEIAELAERRRRPFAPDALTGILVF